MNINLKRAIVGLTLSLSMGMANASTYTIGDLTNPTYYDPLLGAFVYNASHTVVGSFLDTYNFSIPTISDIGGIVTNVSGTLRFRTLDISGLTLSLLNGSQQSMAPPGSALAVLDLAPGSYSFTVGGTGNGTYGRGRYDFSAVAAPVPEPSSWAMMLGGLGLIGFMSGRRRKYF